MLIDQLGDDVLSPERAHVLDEARVVDVSDTACPDVWIHDGGGGDDKRAGCCEELEEAAAEGMSPLMELRSSRVVTSNALKSMLTCTSDFMEISKKTQPSLRWLEQDNGSLPKTT